MHIVDSQPVPLVHALSIGRCRNPSCALRIKGYPLFRFRCISIAPERVRILHDALDVERLKPRLFNRVTGCGAWDVAADAPVVVSTSRFTAEKRLDVLIRMIPEVLEKEPRARFIFAGSGRTSKPADN